MHLGSFRMCAACRARLLYASARTHTRGKAWTVFRPGVYITPVTCTRPGVQCCGRSSCLDVRIDFLCVPHSLVPWHKMLLLCQGTNRTFSVRCSCYPSQRSQVRGPGGRRAARRRRGPGLARRRGRRSDGHDAPSDHKCAERTLRTTSPPARVLGCVVLHQFPYRQPLPIHGSMGPPPQPGPTQVRQPP